MVIQTPWIERKFVFNFPVGLFPIINERLRGTIPRIFSIIENRTEEELRIRQDGRWSPNEIIGHLCDLEELWDQRITDFLEKKQVLTAADMTNQKTHVAGYNTKDASELAHRFSILRKRLIERVSGLDETEAAQTALHPRLQTPMRLVDSLFFAAEHDDHELAKLRGLLS